MTIAIYMAVRSLKEVRREHILRVLEETNWDLKRASEILKVSESYIKKEISKIKREEAKLKGNFKP